MRIGIVGAGSVGATVAYSVACAGLASRLMLADVDRDRAQGEAMDLAHCAAFVPPVDITAGGLDVCQEADAVVITAGARRRPGEQRAELARRNVDVFRQLAAPLAAANPRAIFVVVSNPVELLTLLLLRHSGLPASAIIGSGTLLDSSRLRHMLAARLRVDPRNVHISVVGEHGPGATPVWSRAQIGEIPLLDFTRRSGVVFGENEKRELFEGMVNAGQAVIRRKGATFYGIAQTVLRILTAVGRDERSILTVCVGLAGVEAVEDLALSLPIVVGREGVLRVLDPGLSPDETAQFRAAAGPLRALAQAAGL